MSRNAVMDRLYSLDVPTRRGVMASHLEPPYRLGGPNLPLTEVVASSTLQLPIHPLLTSAQQDHVLAALEIVTSESESP